MPRRASGSGTRPTPAGELAYRRRHVWMPDPIATPSNAPAPALAMVNAPALHDDPGPPPSPQSDGKTSAPARAKASPPTTSPVTVLLPRTQRESATRTDCTVSPAVIWRTVGAVVTAASRPSRRG